MDTQKLIIDYKEVLGKSLKEIDNNQDINPIRCYEIAFITQKGMEEKNYKCYVESGFYKDRRELIEHSWVIIPGSIGRLNGISLDFNFRKWFSEYGINVPLINFVNRGKIVTTRRIYTLNGNEIKRNIFSRNYIRKTTEYNLTKGIEKLAQELFYK